MHIFPLILGLLAIVLFLIDFSGRRLGRSFTPVALALLTAMLILHFMIRSSDVLTLGVAQ